LSKAFADTGCTGHFLQSHSPCVNKQPATHNIQVWPPNGTSTITSTHTALLDIPSLPLAARQAHIFPALAHSALLSISQFCDNCFEARFTDKHVQILQTNNNNIVIQGDRDSTTSLWNIGLQATTNRPMPMEHSAYNVHTLQPAHTANHVHELQLKQDIVTYLHRACFSPTPSTWIKAIEAGYLATWPGLTVDLVKKNTFPSLLPQRKATSDNNNKNSDQQNPTLIHPTTLPQLFP
jgi:hypothetical protein